jgi:hypothetical protein
MVRAEGGMFMPAAPSPVVLLIPGFFGFNAFGPDKAPRLEYFAGVREVLSPVLPQNYVILVHEPPPTGSLDSRVASLHDVVRDLRDGKKLPHAEEAVTAERVHLVGHSTGGVDARPLANPQFHWTGGPLGDERRKVIDAIGTIVTISAPFRGTPLVSHARLFRDGALALAQWLTLLGISRNGALDSLALQLLHAGSRSASPPLTVAARRQLLAQAARQGAKRDGASDRDADLVAEQVQEFLRKIDADRALFDDLSVENMKTVNKEVDGGDDLERIHSYVTVSPKPPFVDLGWDALGRFVYRTLYGFTARDPLSTAQPKGEPLGPAEKIRDVTKDRLSCDGVVPTRSQTLAGKAERVVLADHLDVVGSFSGGTGADVMRSHSNFDAEEFQELWLGIAALVAPPRRGARA